MVPAMPTTPAAILRRAKRRRIMDCTLITGQMGLECPNKKGAGVGLLVEPPQIREAAGSPRPNAAVCVNGNIAKYFARKEMYDSALVRNIKGLDIAEQLGDKRLMLFNK